jgi:polysaccharide export outer membrane protein
MIFTRFALSATRASSVIFLLAGCFPLTAAENEISQRPPAPADQSGDYRLGPEDVIDVFVWQEKDLSTTVVVRPDGKISLPLAGELEASGKNTNQLQQEIADKLQRYVNQPVVNVMVKQINSLKISVLGEVHKPDVYRIKNRVTVLDAIALAGGFTDLARPTRVVVLRNSPAGQQRIKVNLKAMVNGDSGQQPFYLQPLDTVVVEGR